MFTNMEGYADPTAGLAMSHYLKECRKWQKKPNTGKRRRKVYVASPYAGDVEHNVTATIGYCRRVIEQGHMPVASHLLYPQILDDEDPNERELGLSFGLALLRMCDEVWVFGPVSPGVTKEIEEAKRLHKQIRFFEEVGK